MQGLQEAGVDIVNCDVVVGTSASAFVGAKLLAEGSIDGLYKAQLSDPVDREQARLRRVFGPVVVGAIRLSRRPRWAWVAHVWFRHNALRAGVRYVVRYGPTETRRLGPVVRIRRLSAATSPPVLARLGTAAVAAAPRKGEDRGIEYWAEMLALVVDWPSSRLLVTAINTADGIRTVFDAGSGVGLARAVAASTAVPTILTPITVGSSKYIDGGAGSQTNADLASDCDEITVIAPVNRGRLADEVASLRAGTAVTVIEPSPRSRAALGSELLRLLDPARKRQAANAGWQDAAGFGVGR